MIRARSCFFWTLFVAYLAGCAWWSLHVPYAPQRLYRAVPDDATVLTAHYNLAGRWSNLSSNPVTATLLASAGLDQATVRDLSGNATFQSWLKKLASDEVIAAYAPSLGVSRRPAWIFASWLGGQSQQLRWMLSTGGKFKPMKRVHHDVWIIRSGGEKKSTPVIVSLVEGMVVGCVGDDVTMIDEVLRVLDSGTSSAVVLPRGGGPDRGWARLTGGVGAGEKVAYEFQDVTAGTIKGSVEIPFVLPVNSSHEPVQGLEDLRALWGDLPLAYTFVDRSIAVACITNALQASWVGAVTGLVGRTEEGTLALCVLGGDFSGRFKGMKLPTIMAGTPVNDPETALRDIADRIDKLNARVRWGLVPQELDVAGHRVFAIESTAKRSTYAKLVLNEQAGYTVGTNWLLFSSNVEGLTNLLVAADHRTVATARAIEPVSSPVQGWINLEQGGKAIRLAITAYYFKLLLDDPSGTEAERQRLNTIKSWVDALAPLHSVRFGMKPDGAITRLTFAAGAE